VGKCNKLYVIYVNYILHLHLQPCKLPGTIFGITRSRAAVLWSGNKGNFSGSHKGLFSRLRRSTRLKAVVVRIVVASNRSEAIILMVDKIPSAVALSRSFPAGLLLDRAYASGGRLP
jgi:hypothetical protein